MDEGDVRGYVTSLQNSSILFTSCCEERVTGKKEKKKSDWEEERIINKLSLIGISTSLIIHNIMCFGDSYYQTFYRYKETPDILVHKRAMKKRKNSPKKNASLTDA